MNPILALVLSFGLCFVSYLSIFGQIGVWGDSITEHERVMLSNNWDGAFVRSAILSNFGFWGWFGKTHPIVITRVKSCEQGFLEFPSVKFANFFFIRFV